MEDKEFLERLGQRITALRKEKGLRVIDVAYKCDMEKSNMIRIEKGRTNPTTLTLRRISEALDISIQALFTDESQESK